jgi:TonB family protein
MKILQFILFLSILQVSSLFSQTDDKYVTITIVEQMPIFKNSNSEDFLLWLYNNLKYPQSAIRDSISGKVIARFKINTLGVVSDIEIIRGVRADLDQESLKVLSASPNWIPARQGHKNVSVYYSIPVIFDINDQFFSKRIISLSKNPRILKNKHNR